MQSLQGIVSHGQGVATISLAPEMSALSERAGISFCPGTLNVRVGSKYAIAPDFEYARPGQLLRLQRCRLRRRDSAESVQCFIMKPSPHDVSYDLIHELLSAFKLREKLALADGTSVVLEVEGDELWWSGQRGTDSTSKNSDEAL